MGDVLDNFIFLTFTLTLLYLLFFSLFRRQSSERSLCSQVSRPPRLCNSRLPINPQPCRIVTFEAVTFPRSSCRLLSSSSPIFTPSPLNFRFRPPVFIRFCFRLCHVPPQIFSGISFSWTTLFRGTVPLSV